MQQSPALTSGHGASAKMNGFGDFTQVILHQRNVGGLYGGVGADCAHGNANCRGGHRRRVVHAVADYANLLVLGDLRMRSIF